MGTLDAALSQAGTLDTSAPPADTGTLAAALKAATGESPPAPPSEDKPPERSWWERAKAAPGDPFSAALGAADAAAHFVSGAGAQVVGGFRAAVPFDPESGRKGQELAESLTWQPRTETGKLLTELPGEALKNVETLGNLAGSKLGVPSAGIVATHPGQSLGDVAFEQASRLPAPFNSIAPAAGAISSTVPSALASMLGARQAIEAARLRGSAPLDDASAVPGSPAGSGAGSAGAVPSGPGGIAAETPEAGAVGARTGVAPTGIPARVTPAPSLAQATNETKAEIAKLQASGVPLNPAALARIAEAESLPVPIRMLGGQATQDVNLLSRQMNSRAADPQTADRLNAQNGELVANVQALRNLAAPDITAQTTPQIGQALIDSYTAKDEALKADITAKYKALSDANGGDFPVDGQSFVSAADAALKQKMKGRYVPPAIAGDLEDLRNGGPMSFEQFENMRTNLAAEGRKAERAGDGNAEAAVNIVRDSLESLPMSSEAANVKPLADAARNAAKARFDLIKADPAYKAALNGTVAPDDFVHRFVVNGKVGDVATMRANLADDPLAQQHMAAGAIDYLGQRAGIRNGVGNFGQDNFNNAMYGKGGLALKMDQIFTPQVAQHVESLANVSRYVKGQPTGSYVNNSNTFVAALGHAAARGVEGLVNYQFGGLPIGTAGKTFVEKQLAKQKSNAALAPAAGAKLSDIGK